jgi:GxxExxY protein
LEAAESLLSFPVFLRFLCSLLFNCLLSSAFSGLSPDEFMHPQFAVADSMTGGVIAAAIEVHRTMGPGLLEPIYEWCLTKELELRGYRVTNQRVVVINYKQFQREEPLKFDILVGDCLLLEIKAVETVHPVHKAQLLSYMKLLNVPLGLLINFHVMKLTDGVSRLLLPGANLEANGL